MCSSTIALLLAVCASTAAVVSAQGNNAGSGSTGGFSWTQVANSAVLQTGDVSSLFATLLCYLATTAHLCAHNIEPHHGQTLWLCRRPKLNNTACVCRVPSMVRARTTREPAASARISQTQTSCPGRTAPS